MDQRISKVVELMSADLGRALPLEALASAVNLSPSRLHNVFKHETGVSPARYLKTLRLERAKELLAESFLSVKEIRVSVGIGDESHFVRDFRKAYGLTPTQYRARHHALAPPAVEEVTCGPADAEEDATTDSPHEPHEPRVESPTDEEGAALLALALPAYG